MTKDEVKAHQQKLKDAGFDSGPIDGLWGRKTENATRAWEKARGQKLPSDTGRNLIELPGGLAKASNAMHPALGSQEREATFGGPFDWVQRPLPDNRENIEIRGGWEEANIITVDLPELAEATNGQYKRMRCNKRASKQLQDLWKAWGAAGLLQQVKTYDGSFVPRLIRGSTRSLSNHAYGTAFDINYEWNQLGRTPAAPGKTGSVWELVSIAHQHGFFWGGFFARGDGMHFEVCQIV
jgi:D-alanyl-D-alanine carboxypeptidase/Putative peptidoglycan binding domain